MPEYGFKGTRPRVDPSAYLAPTATVIGDVTIGRNSSVWFNCVIRADTDPIVIGSETNIQDLTVCHADPGKPLKMGDRVTIGHRCVVHGCTIEDDCLIGMGAIVMNGARIGRHSVVAAGSVILEDAQIPPFSLVAGVPGRVKRDVDEYLTQDVIHSAREYVDRTKAYGSAGSLSLIDGGDGRGSGRSPGESGP